MDTQTEASYNPWSNDDTSVGLRNAIIIAEKTGHISRTEGSDESMKTRLDDMPSMKLAEVLKTISHQNEQMNKVNLDIQKRMLYHETKDIMDVSAIEKRTEEVKKLSDHIQLVMNSKEALVTRLQQPHAGTFIRLEAAFHRYASEFFCQLAPLLSDLTSHLDDLSWISMNTFPPSQLDPLVTELSSMLASLQTQFQLVAQMSQSIRNLHTPDDDSQNLSVY